MTKENDDYQDCAYCHAQITEIDLVPDIDDDREWARLSKKHAPDCEWIITRAHRINV